MQNSIVRPDFHVTIAESIVKDIRSNLSHYYYYFGKTLPFDNFDTIEEPVSTIKYELQTRSDIIAMKRITNNDVSFIVPRYDWTSGTVYDHYDDDYSTSNPAYSGATSLDKAKFYIIVPTTLRIYKCLDNNNNSVSTIEPSNTDVESFITEDGYKWKFMMEVPLSLKDKFLTKGTIPISKAILSRYYNNAGISDVTISNGGSNYAVGNTVKLSIPSNTGSNAVLQPVVTDGQISQIVIINGGNGYTTPINVLVTSDTGTGAVLTPVINNLGVITSVTVTNGGSNYPVAPLLNVLSITGQDAKLEPIIENGSFTGVTIIDPGYGYQDSIIQVTDTTGTGANLIAEATFGKINTKQANVENSAVSGSIEFIKVIDKGYNYSNPTVTITGSGYGCTGTVVLDTNRQVKGILITSKGYGYTHAVATIQDTLTGEGFGCTLRPIISPSGGHGYNAIKELYAYSLMLSSSLKDKKFLGHSVTNDYRQFGIIKNPLHTNGTYITTDIGVNCFSVDAITTHSINLFPEDSILTVVGSEFNNNKRFLIVSRKSITDGICFLLKPLDNSTLVNGYTLTSGSQNIIIGNVIPPNVDILSGDLLYIDNRAAFYQSEEQLVSLQTVIKF